MSDLAAPIYVVTGGDEVMTFWCFVAVMEKMVRFPGPPFTDSISFSKAAMLTIIVQKQNFLRDQSGMKKQLATLQQLLAVMDPALYKHLGEHREMRLLHRHQLAHPLRRKDRQLESLLLLPVSSLMFVLCDMGSNR